MKRQSSVADVLRPERGRGLFYTRDSGGKHEMTPGQYVLWARRQAELDGVAFAGHARRVGRDDPYRPVRHRRPVPRLRTSPATGCRGPGWTH